MKREVLALILLVLAVPLAYSLNLGTVKGYSLNSSGNYETNTNINITVIGCTGSGCSATDITDANGFYIETNLNILPGNNVTVTARKNTAYGSGSGIAVGSGSVGVATINVTMCVAPQIPSLTAVADSHNNSLVVMSWTTFKSGPEYDEFQFDSESTNTSAVSPQRRANVAYQTHTWKVRTCNTLCCSDYAPDTFITVNNLPSQPTLVDEPNTNQNTITFNWTQSGSDPDGDTTTFDFQIDGVTTSNVTSPYTVSGITAGSHTWGVRVCDGISCTSFSQDSFSITNAAAAAPVLTDQPHTSSTTINFSWINYSDPDNDATRNEFQLSTDSNFSTIILDDSDVDSPYTVSSLSTLSLYFWRVRTCDTQNACSSYSSDLFFVYTATNGTTTTTVVSGGTKTKIVNGTCAPQWECGDWNICSSRGITTRTCIDVNECAGSIPSGYNYCTYAGPRTEAPLPPSSAGRFFLGNFNQEDVLQNEMGIGQEWEFIYGQDQHIVKVIDITDNGALIEISSEVKEYFIPANESVFVDLDEDGTDDASIRIVQKNHQSISLVFSLLHEAPRERLPLSGELLVKRIQEQLRNSGIIPWILLSIIAVLGSVMYYQHSYVVREKKTDAVLMKYVQSALNKGFTKQHIQQKLLMSGFAQEEIDYVFNKLERQSKNAVPQEH